MTDDQLRAYAIAGVTSRLAALDAERADLQAILSRLTEPDSSSDEPPRTSMSDEGRKRIGDAARRRWAARREALAEAAEAASGDEPETARVLPRRGRLARGLEPAAPVLPPMPRLIKARLA